MDTRSQDTECIHFNSDNRVINLNREPSKADRFAEKNASNHRASFGSYTNSSVDEFGVHNEVENRLPIRRANTYSLELPYLLVLMVSIRYRPCKRAMRVDHVKKPSIWSRHDTGAWDTMLFFGALSAMRLSMVRKPNQTEA